jgi:hypothetical protein
VEVFRILLRATTDCRSNGALFSSLSDHNPPPQHTGNKKDTGTMIAIIRRPPAAPIREVSAIVVRRAIDHDDSDAVMYFLSMKLTNSLFYSLLFYVHRLGEPGDKR